MCPPYMKLAPEKLQLGYYWSEVYMCVCVCVLVCERACVHTNLIII